MAQYRISWRRYSNGLLLTSGSYISSSPRDGDEHDPNDYGKYTSYSSTLISSDPEPTPDPTPKPTPNPGYSGGYTPPTPKNKPPEISGKDEDLGGRNKPFKYEYTVKDAEQVRVDISLNQEVVETTANAPRGTVLSFTVTEELLKGLKIGEKNYLIIKATDSKGASSLRNLTFTRINAAPRITVETTIPDLKAVEDTFTVRYVAVDDEGDTMKGRVLIDGIGGDFVAIKGGGQAVYDLPKAQFLEIPPGEHAITVEVVDSGGMRSTESVRFKRIAPEIVMELEPVVDTVTLAKKILAAYTLIKGGSRVTVKIEASNNAKDASPKWEDITEKVESGLIYTFLNENATDAAAVNIRFVIKSNGEPKETIFKGFSGRIE